MMAFFNEDYIQKAYSYERMQVSPIAAFRPFRDSA